MSKSTETQPRFVHDHDCTWLGQHNEADLYFCGQAGGKVPTVIARFSDDGPDYTSGLVFADIDPHLGVARDRAQDAGLL